MSGGRLAASGSAPAFTPRNPAYRAALDAYVAAQTFLSLIGVEPGGVEPGEVEYRVAFRPELGQQDGFFHGGLIGAVAEAVMGAAAFTLVEPGANVVGASFRLDLLAPGLGPRLTARGRVVKSGRMLIVCRADVIVDTPEGDTILAAIAQGSMAVIAPR